MTSAKGASRIADVPPDHLARLNRGEAETRTLAEGLAMSFPTLMAQVDPALAEAAAADLPADIGITQRMARAGALLWGRFGREGLATLSAHPSDTVRGWAAFAIAAAPDWDLPQRLNAVRPLADDAHFGVREWAWLALRPSLAAQITPGLRLLQPWTAEASAYLRRFASEATRPRGVWCAHIPALKENPAAALPLLAALRRDPSDYVQDSVANWLNDAAKSRPDWVQSVLAEWRAEGTVAPRLLKRAARSLKQIPSG